MDQEPYPNQEDGYSTGLAGSRYQLMSLFGVEVEEDLQQCSGNGGRGVVNSRPWKIGEDEEQKWNYGMKGGQRKCWRRITMCALKLIEGWSDLNTSIYQ